MSPVPPQVTYTGGQLTITAPNSTLADILNAVKVRTGAKVELPSSTSQERVAVQLGPGNPRDVLAQLLHGSPYDYILLGSDQDPIAVTQILLTRHEGGATVAAVSHNPAPSQPEPSEEEAETEPAPQPMQQQPGGAAPASAAPGSPMAGPPAMQQAPDQNAPGAQATPGNAAPPQENQPKTPEQLLQELQRMQQQERRNRPPRPPR